METRARYALIGLFMLAVILASFGFVYWLENKGGFAERKTYQVRFQGSVSGLLVGSAVLFNGIRVGEVTNLTLSADAPDQVIATIGVDPNTPIRSDTEVGLETQGLTGGAAVTLRGGTAGAPLPVADGGAVPVLTAPSMASQDWTQAAREAFQNMDAVLTDNSASLHSAIKNIDTFAQALARNSDKVDGILAGIERMTGGSTPPGEIPTYDLIAATGFPPPPKPLPSWLLVVPEPNTLMGFNTDKILLQPASGESVPLANARWSDNLPVLAPGEGDPELRECRLRQVWSAGRAKASPAATSCSSTSAASMSRRRVRAEAEIGFVAKILDQDGKILAAKEFQGSAPPAGSDAKAYVAAFNQALGKLLTELFDWSTAAIAAAPPPSAPSPAEPPALDAPMPPMPPAPTADTP